MTTKKKPTIEYKPTRKKPLQRKPTEWPTEWKPTTEYKPPKKKLTTEFKRVRRKPITSEEAYEELLHGKKSLLPLRKKKEPSTIVNIKQPIAGRRKGEPVPLPPPKPIKPAPRRSPTLKWNIKKR